MSTMENQIQKEKKSVFRIWAEKHPTTILIIGMVIGIILFYGCLVLWGTSI
jgi:hypothetical protein